MDLNESSDEAEKASSSAAVASVSRDYDSCNSGPGAKHVVHCRNN